MKGGDRRNAGVSRGGATDAPGLEMDYIWSKRYTLSNTYNTLPTTNTNMANQLPLQLGANRKHESQPRGILIDGRPLYDL